MLCKQCGFNLTNHANFCPSCGKKVTEEERQESLPQKFSTSWLKILLTVPLIILILMISVMLLSEDMTDIVSQQLKSVKEGKVTEGYYNYTSKSFQEMTSLEHFTEFMNAYPAFAHNQSVRFIDRTTDHNTGALHAMLLTEQGVEVPVRYSLVKESNKWKIESIKLEDNGEKKAFDSKPLENVIKSQLELIRNKSLKQAYEEYTSKDFQNTTPYKDFEEFINDNISFLENVSIDLEGLSFDNNIATMTGRLKSKEGKEYLVEYDLVEEDGIWKIFHLQVSDAEKKANSVISTMIFSRFALGLELGDDGVITSPKTLFKTNSGDLYLNLYVENVKADTKIQVVFEHIDSRSTIEPVSTKVSESGNAMLTFIFSPPDTGWPKGKYRLMASSSTGESEIFEFTVEE